MARFVIDKSSDGQYFFKFKADNGQVIATSETYTTKQACEHGVDVIKKHAASAEVVDITD